MDETKELIVIVGATGVGKSAYALRLSRELHAPIISADSRQIYRGMEIGTDAPGAEVRAEIPHFFVGTRELTEPYSAYDYAQEARETIAALFTRHDTILVVGGSMMYITALLYGMDDVPMPDPMVREELWRRFRCEGLAPLLAQIKEVDPDYLSRIDPHNHKRIIRALEVYLTSGRPYSSYHTGVRQSSLPYKIRLVGIERPRDQLYERINARVDSMISQGLVEEVRALLPYRHLNALNTIGYKELFAYLDGEASLEESIALIAKHTRTFARRQITFFSRMPEIQWLSADQ